MRGILIFVVAAGCRLGTGGGMTMSKPAPSPPVIDRDPRPPSVRDPALVKTLPPKPAAHPYVDPTPPLTSEPSPTPAPSAPPKPQPMPDMPGI